MTDASAREEKEPEVGSYFVANYPPFSVWTRDAVARDARPALDAAGAPVPLGLYLHIPFCRKRCHFCYFRVYTEQECAGGRALPRLLAREWELYASCRPSRAGRSTSCYFGGGTPSFLSTQQLESLVERLKARHAVDEAPRRSHSSASRAR